jgi:flavin-binding protein dodecin
MLRHCGLRRAPVQPQAGPLTRALVRAQVSDPARRSRRVSSLAEDTTMAVARVTEIIASSKKSFEDAVSVGVNRATKTLKNVEGAWVQDQKVMVKNGKIVEYRVNLKVTFVLAD